MDFTDELFKSLRSKKSEDERCKIVLKCLEAGANVNASDAQKKNNTPLHIAVQNSDYEIVKLLLDKKADVTAKNDLNKNPLELAKSLPEVDEQIIALLETNMLTKIDNFIYNEEELGHEKREGTASGVCGQFYETKLLSLILLRCLTDDKIDNFYLGTNLKNVGDLDDVCLKYSLKVDTNKTEIRMLFIQAKHKETRVSANKVTLDDLKNSEDFRLSKYYDSYKTIRNKFRNDINDVMFKGTYTDIDCDFIIFTPSENGIKNDLKTNSIQLGHRFEIFFCSRDNLKNVFAIPQFNNKENTFQLSDKLRKKFSNLFVLQEIESLGEVLKKSIVTHNDELYSDMMGNDLIKKYNILLALEVLFVEDIVEENCGEGTSRGLIQANSYRKATFRPDFFVTQDIYLAYLRTNIFKNVSELEIDEYKLQPEPKSFKIPISFSNLDLNVQEKKKKKRMEYLARTIVQLTDIAIKNNTNVIKIDENLFGQNKADFDIHRGFIEYNGGIASLVGNLLQLDNETKLLKFKEPGSQLKNKITKFIDELKKQFHENYKNENHLMNNSKNFFDELTLQFNEHIKNESDLKNNSTQFLDELIKQFYEHYQNEINFHKIRAQFMDKLKEYLNENNTKENNLIKISTEFLDELKKELNAFFKIESLIYQLRFDIDIFNFPKLSFDYDNALATDYLSKLWFLTNQCQQDELETIMKMEIESQYYQKNKHRLLRIQTDAIFLKFHDEIQKWWMSKKRSHYLTKRCKFYETAKQTIIDSSILSVLNFFTKNSIRKYQIKFTGDVIQMNKLNKFLTESNANIFNIISSQSLITMIKLTQFFENNVNVKFLDFEYILENGCYEMVRSEIQKAELNTIVFSKIKPDNIQTFCDIVNHVTQDSRKKIIVVTESHIAKTVESQCDVLIECEIDEKCDINSIIDSDILCENLNLDFQGQEVNFNRVIDRNSRYLVNGAILSKFIQNDKIQIGKPLKSMLYDQVKQYCIPRNLTRGQEYFMKTFRDIHENVVLILAEPGMGKSVLMHQLANQTKEYEHNNCLPSSWIVFINLRDYTTEFKKWKEENIDVTKNESIRFICKAAVDILSSNEKNKIKGEKSNLNSFKILIEGDKIRLKSFIKDDQMLFELQLFIEYYNKNDVIIIFDGFDEICPQYEIQVRTLIKELTRNYHLPGCKILNPSSVIDSTISMFKKSLNQEISTVCKCPLAGSNFPQIWVTTRVYNNIKSALVADLGVRAFTLEPLSKHEQTTYLMGYFKIHFDIPDLTEEDIDNLNDFLDYMLNTLSDESRHLAMVSVPLYTVYVTSVKYFYSKLIDDANEKVGIDLEPFRKKCVDAYKVVTSYGPVFERQQNIREQAVVSENPLHLYMAAKYFYSQIKDHINEVEGRNKWDINIKSFDLFEKFIDTKFTEIRFEEKNEIDTSKPDNDNILQREKTEFFNDHKKVALFAIFDRKDLKKLLPENIFDEIDEIMTKIDMGMEKNGFIVNCFNKIPQFVHLVFAEYFAIEYIAELLILVSNSELEHPTLEELWYFVMNVVLYKATGGVRTFFNHKLRNDSKFLNEISTDETKMIVFQSLIRQGKENEMTPEGYNSSFKILRTSLNIAIEESLFDIQNYIFSCIAFSLNEDNIDEFANITANSLLFLIALGSNNDDFIHKLRNCLGNVHYNDDKFLYMVIPTFARDILPFKVNAQTFMMAWNMFQRLIPQLAEVNIDEAAMTPTIRYVIMDYVRFLWDLATKVYSF